MRQKKGYQHSNGPRVQGSRFRAFIARPAPPGANNMLINHATHFNQNPLELFPCNCIIIASSTATTCSATKCAKYCEIIKWKWTRLCEQNSWAKTHCSHPQHSIHQWMSYHGVLVFQYAEHTVPPKHGHTMAQKATNGIKWTQFLHCSCSDCRPFQSQLFFYKKYFPSNI